MVLLMPVLARLIPRLAARGVPGRDGPIPTATMTATAARVLNPAGQAPRSAREIVLIQTLATRSLPIQKLRIAIRSRAAGMAHAMMETAAGPITEKVVQIASPIAAGAFVRRDRFKRGIVRQGSMKPTAAARGITARAGRVRET